MLLVILILVGVVVVSVQAAVVVKDRNSQTDRLVDGWLIEVQLHLQSPSHVCTEVPYHLHYVFACVLSFLVLSVVVVVLVRNDVALFVVGFVVVVGNCVVVVDIVVDRMLDVGKKGVLSLSLLLLVWVWLPLMEIVLAVDVVVLVDTVEDVAETQSLVVERVLLCVGVGVGAVAVGVVQHAGVQQMMEQFVWC